jgi:nicotinamidase-related amidase
MINVISCLSFSDDKVLFRFFSNFFKLGAKFSPMKNIPLLILTILLAFSTVSAQESKPEKIVMKPALLVIDVQKQFLPMMSQEDQDKAIMMMNWSMWVFRQYDLPVIRVYHTSEEYGPKPGTPEFQFADSLKVMETDPMIIKTYGSAFNKTELNDLLKKEGVNTLFLCGLSSIGCVLATYLDAANYDYQAFLIKDAMIGPDAEYTNQVEQMFGALDLENVYYMMKIRQE